MNEEYKPAEPPTTPARYLRAAQAAAYLQDVCGAYTEDTLATYRCRGGGPRFRVLGRFPVYSVVDLDQWLTERLTAPLNRHAERQSA